MDFEGIKDIIKAMDNSTLDYLEVNWQGISFVMKKIPSLHSLPSVFLTLNPFIMQSKTPFLKIDTII